MKKSEIVLAILSVIALVLNLLLIPCSEILTCLSLLGLAIIYHYLGFALFNNIKLKNVFKKDSYKGITKFRILGAIGAGFSLSMTVIGIMFKFQSFPGASFMLIGGLIGLLIVTIIGIIRYSKNKSDYYTKIFKRVAIIGGIGLVLILMPKSALSEFKYRNHPDYLKAVKEAVANPENEELWGKVNEERQKINH